MSSESPHIRENITAQRTYNRQKYCKILKLIKDSNLRDDPIYFLKIYELLPQLGIGSMEITNFSKFMRDAEEWGMIEGQKYNPATGYRYLTITKVAEEFIIYSEKNSTKPFHEQTVTERYISKSGDNTLSNFKEIANKARGHAITTREAAQALGLTRKDFLALLQETGNKMHHRYPA